MVGAEMVGDSTRFLMLGFGVPLETNRVGLEVGAELLDGDGRDRRGINAARKECPKGDVADEPPLDGSRQDLLKLVGKVVKRTCRCLIGRSLECEVGFHGDATGRVESQPMGWRQLAAGAVDRVRAGDVLQTK